MAAGDQACERCAVEAGCAVKPDPWAPAQEALWDIVRAWVDEKYADDPQQIAERCLQIMKDVNDTEGAPFIFVCELARMMAVMVAKYLAIGEDELPSREEVMEEIDTLELEYIEEAVLAEEE